MGVLAPHRTPHRAHAARACLAPRAPRVSVVRSFVRTPSDTKNLANFWTEATTQFGDPGATFYMQDTGLISMNNSKGGSQASTPPLPPPRSGGGPNSHAIIAAAAPIIPVS